MIWDDGDGDELLDDPDGDDIAPEPTLAQGDDSWRPVPPKPPLYSGPFEIVAEETHATGTRWQTTRRVVIGTTIDLARAYEVCRALNAPASHRADGGVRYFFRPLGPKGVDG